MNTCQTCKFFKPFSVYKFDVLYQGEYNHSYYSIDINDYYETPVTKISSIEEIKHPFGHCNNPKIVYTGGGGEIEKDIQNPPDSFIYSDGEAYSAYHYVGKDFGCIHHEKQ